MKKFIALFICVFIAFLFEGCAPYAYTSQNDLPYNDEQIEPAPKPKAKPRPVVRKAKPAPRRPKVITKAVPKTVTKKVVFIQKNLRLKFQKIILLKFWVV